MEENLKQLLLKDLCARLPYQVKVKLHDEICTVIGYADDFIILTSDTPIGQQTNIVNVKPYLRSMSSMTEEEQFQLGRLLGATSYNLLKGEYSSLKELLEYGYKNHIDLFGLIPKGLALPATEGMYNIK